MKLLIPIGVAVAALTVTVGAQDSAAQDSTVKSRTKIKGDDAHLVSMTGCLRQDLGTSDYMLIGRLVTSGDDLKTKTKVKTDVDKDQTKVTSTTTTKADDGRTVATGGYLSTYLLMPRDGVNLSSYIGHQVQVAAVMVEPGHHDADVTIKDKTTVDPEHGRDSTSRTKSKVEVKRGGYGYTVVSVKPLAGTCAQ